MKTLKLLTISCVIGLFGAGCTSPDLVVESLVVDGDPTVNADGSVDVPIELVVRNQGTGSASTFKVAVDFTSSEGTFVVAFTVPGESDIWYPKTETALAPGSTVSFAGSLVFASNSSALGENVSLVATADSCSGDEFMPEYCRVRESDEANNESSATEVTLP